MTAREIELTGGSPWGFRMHGGADQQQPLRISRRYSDSLERVLDVNPGRKAALSGVREGDIITSINGRQTRSMSNAEAHAMLRSAGPVLRLGLNEDRETSPRRRSLGKSGGLELKRPSQLIAEMQGGKAIPQAPVYATTRTSQSPLRTASSPFRTPLNSAPTLSSSSLVKSATEEPMRFHPTNPFYSTIPSNSTIASKLPVPNGKTPFSSLDRSKSNKSTPAKFPTDSTDSQSQNFNTANSGATSLPFGTSGYNGSTENFCDVGGSFTGFNGHQSSRENIYYVPGINGVDPFEKYLKNGDVRVGENALNGEVVTLRSTITEHKVNEYEEVRTVKKIIMNGGNDTETSGIADEANAAERPPAGDVGVTTKPPLKSPPAQSTPAAAAPPALPPPQAKQTVMIAPTFKARSTSPAVWSPGGGAAPPPAAPPPRSAPGPAPAPPPPPPPVWRPNSAGPSPQPQRKLNPVQFEDKELNNIENSPRAPQTWDSAPALHDSAAPRLPTSYSAPPAGLNSLGGGAGRLPRAQNPTITLLQKNREGQLGRVQEQQRRQLPRDRPAPPSNDPVHALRRGYASESETDRLWEREATSARGAAGMGDGDKKVEGIGPTTKEGMPVALRSEVKDPSRWYKKMYDTIHKSKYDDDSVTIRYKTRRGEPSIHRTGNRSQYAYFDPRSGYLSEPEGGAGRGGGAWSDYESDGTQRRRTASVQGEEREEETRFMPSNKYSTLASARASQEVYKNQPGKIENYMPGRSSVVDKEAKQWWDEVMDIFDGQLSSTSTNSLQQPSPKEKKDITSAILSKSNMARALKESGYESDSTLVFRRRPDDTEAPLSPAERRAAYRDLQAGGEPPLKGFRSPAPPRHQEPDSAPVPPPKRSNHGSYSDTESPRRYVESDVNIHYRCPVRRDPLPHVPERELARRQAEHMRRLYQEERRRKYLQELQDMQSRRHTDNFTPQQKTILPLNRYDNHDSVLGSNKRIFARALYAFVGQNSRELCFRKGDIINVRRQIDANWYEGELNGKIGLFPYNYVEIIKGDNAHVQTKPSPATEGKARAKFDFTAQTSLELPLKKGEVVVLSRRIDQNWWEGRNNGGKTGIFPDSYVQVLQEPSLNKPELPPPQNNKPLASPASHGLLSGSAKQSMGPHSYQPQLNSASLSNGPQPNQPLTGTYSANFHAKPVQATLTPSERGYGPPSSPGVDLNNHEPLYIDTNAEAVPYRAMYKYRPQNPDELELNEGDTVYVLEKCDDGWYVGSSQRTGTFGTFPGNYVERI